MLIDTHCHLGDPAFAEDREVVVGRMTAAGVGRALVIESVIEQVAATRAWAATVPGFRIATACHPHDASQWSPELAARLDEAWADPLVAAVGEIGLDYHYDHSPRPAQRAVFEAQLAAAAERHLPVVIHAREADADVAAILRNAAGVRIVLHSFSSGPELARAGLDAGWYFSFSGMVTFKSWQQDDTVRAVPADRLLVETDAPYLAPVPHRGRRNEPAFVVEVARRLATIRGTDVETLAAVTTANAEALFWNEQPHHEPLTGDGP